MSMSDEWYNRISIFTKDGTWIAWGPGAGDGELNRSSGMDFDPDDNLYVVDSLNNRAEVHQRGQVHRQVGHGRQRCCEFMPWVSTLTPRAMCT